MFTKQTLVPLVGALAMASAQTTTSSVEYPTESQIEASAATVQPYSPVSNVKGLAFDRFTDIWFENQVGLNSVELLGFQCSSLNCSTTTSLLVMTTFPSLPPRVSFCMASLLLTETLWPSR